MLPSPSEPQSTGASVALGGAALAASAVLAGIALRNKSPLPLAAGLAAAAAASLSLMKKTKGDGAELEDEVSAESSAATPSSSPAPMYGGPSKFQILDESDLDEEAEEEPRDWVDAGAIFASEPSPGTLPPVTSLPVAMTLPAYATSFPLLDDDGNVIAGHQMLPVQLPTALAESSEEFGFPLGPLIWEPETEAGTQICMEPEDDFLWFGSRKATLPPPSQLACEIVVPMSGTATLPAVTQPTLLAPGGISWSPHLNPTTPLQLTESPVPESVASILDCLRAEAALKGDVAAAGLPFSSPSSTNRPAMPGRPASQEPLSFADWMLSTQQSTTSSTASSVTSDVPDHAYLRAPLPAPRRPGEPPKLLADEPTDNSSSHRPGMTEREQLHQPALVYHRSVAPMAPVDQEEKSDGNRPLTVVLVALILTVALLAMAIWGDGYRSRKDTPPPPWTQEPVTAKERATAAAVPNP